MSAEKIRINCGTHELFSIVEGILLDMGYFYTSDSFRSSSGVVAIVHVPSKRLFYSSIMTDISGVKYLDIDLTDLAGGVYAKAK